MDATRRARGCLFLVITGAVLVVYMCHGNYGQDQRSDPVMIAEAEVLPVRGLLEKLPTKQDVSIEQNTSRFQSAFVSDCRQVFPWRHTSINRMPDMKVRKTSIYYCGIPKIGTTFTKMLLQKIPECEQRRHDVCEIDVPSEKLTKHAIASSTYSFMWIRDPYSRLFSAYESKLYHPNLFWKSLGRHIIKVVRNGAGGEGQTSKWKRLTRTLGYDVTFTEFIRFIFQSAANGKKLNIHFRPIHKMCNPCITRFDFIGRLESFSESVAQVCTTIREIGLLSSVNGSIKCNSIKSDSYVFSRIKHLFRFLIKLNYIPISIYKELMQRTWSSYQIRGMVSKSLSMPWSDKELRTVTLDQYVDAVRAAMSASSNSTGLRPQRREAMLQAYRTVPRADMALLKKFVSTDCRLFGYEQEPPDLFKATQVDTPSATFDYFNGLLR